MSDSQGASNSFEPLLRPMMDYWAAYTQDWLKATESDAKATQREWLDSASTAVDEYLRSPLFLGLFKQHIDTLIELQQRTQDANGSTISSMCEVVQQLQRIEERLAAIEQRLAESGGPP